MQQVVRAGEGVVPTQFETMDDVLYNVPEMTHKPKSNTRKLLANASTAGTQNCCFPYQI
jgi:hypothetical protein